jgi:two-component system OmpR family sensor kinase
VSLRAWLAVRFSLLLMASMVVYVFAIVVARQAGSYSDAAALAQERARAASLIIRRTADAGEPITARGMRELLDVLPGYLWVLDSFEVIYASPPAASLDSNTIRAVNEGLKTMRLDSAPSRQVSIRGAAALVEKPDLLPNGRVLRAVAAVPLADVSLPPLELLGTALVVMPLILALSVGGAFLIAARATEPLERITKEVVEITDGRSLHRRLHPEEGSAELARLTAQLNEMIGRLEMSFLALRRFTADASHELKTPLAVLRADVERAMHTPQGSTDQLVALEEALHETTRMADLVESLLTLARADEGRFDLLREPVEMEPLARDVFETALILGENAGLNVTMPRVENSIVNGDKTRLRQLFLNLITNAIKYTPRGGDVELQLTANDEEASFSVRDTGIGIAAIDLPNIFDRFYRADRVRSRQSERGGFGLGLSISQWIAQAHGGTLTVQSRLHRGSTFTVTLPVSARSGTPSVERRQLPAHPVTAG